MNSVTIRQELNGVVNPSQPTEERAKLAYSLESGLLELKQGVARNFLSMGKILKEVRDNGYYQDLGYDVFVEWIRSPDISLSERWAWSAINIYDTFVEKLKMDFDEVAKIDYSKLYEITATVKGDLENAERWIDAAKNMRKIDLVRELQEHRISEQAKLIEPSKEDSKIMLGDAITTMLAMKDQSVDAIITDPPVEWNDWHYRWMEQAYRLLKKDGSFVIMTNKQNLLPIAHVMDKLDLNLAGTIAWIYDPDNVTVEKLNQAHNLILWASKGKPQCNTTDVTTDVWQIKQTHKFNHPDEKPEELLERLIELITHSGQVVLDPFLGSGTTIAVANRLGRQYRGVEISEFWYKISLERILHDKQSV